jgi:nucleoside-triphosphatase THEP1
MEIILVTGIVNSGKTTLMEELAEQESLQGNSLSGIIAPGVFKEGEKIGFDVTDLSTGHSKPLARAGNSGMRGFSAGRFVFSNEGLNFAKKALLNFRPGGVVFLDEVGPLELNGGGYTGCLRRLLRSDIGRLYISVRHECLPAVRRKFLFPRPATVMETESFAGDMRLAHLIRKCDVGSWR